jgi:hypothetical protein
LSYLFIVGGETGVALFVDDLSHADHIARSVLDGHAQQCLCSIARLHVDFTVETLILPRKKKNQKLIVRLLRKHRNRTSSGSAV